MNTAIEKTAIIKAFNAPARESIMALQTHLQDMPQVDCPLVHHFAPGLYARQIFMKAGDLVIGKIHNHAHVNNISKGRVLVTTEFGKEELVAPCQFISKAGSKRAVLVLEDCIWTTYHPTKETDLAKIEADVIAKDYDEFESKKLGFFDKCKKLLKVKLWLG
jgi:hypothetical protein